MASGAYGGGGGVHPHGGAHTAGTGANVQHSRGGNNAWCPGPSVAMEPFPGNSSPDRLSQGYRDPAHSGPDVLLGGLGDVGSNLMLNVGMQYGQRIIQDGEAGLAQYLPFLHRLKCYFRVDNAYVRSKLSILLFPFFRKPGKSRTDASDHASFGTAPGTGMSVGPNASPQISMSLPIDDVNAFDLYIPFMAAISYVMLAVIIHGLRYEHESLKVDFITATLTSAVAWTMVEVLALKAARYAYGVVPDVAFLDAVALSGYKFVLVCLLLIIKELLQDGAGNTMLLPYLAFVAYSCAANGFTVMNSVLRLYTLGDRRVPPNARMLAITAVLIQVPLVLWLSLKSA